MLSNLNRFFKKITRRFLDKFAIKQVLNIPRILHVLLHYLVKH